MTRVGLLHVLNIMTGDSSTSEPSEAAPLLTPGVWTWYTDPRAVRSGEVTYIGAINSSGAATVTEFDHATNTLSDPVVLRAALGVNDHLNPSLLVRDDGRLLAFYTYFSGTELYMRVSTNPYDASAWEAEVDLGTLITLAGRPTYPTPFQLAGESDAILLMFRDNNVTHGRGEYLTKSTDGGETWSEPLMWLKSTFERPYVIFAQNGPARIDFVTSAASPANDPACSIYAGYYQGGSLYKSDGTLVGALDGTVYDVTAFTLVWDGTITSAWTHSIAIDGSGLPVAVFAVFPTAASDHRYRYARWDGAQWTTNEICEAGGPLYAGEIYYSGGAYIDPERVGRVYCSREDGDGIHQLWRYETTDNGVTWSGVQLAQRSDPTFRPYVVKGHGGDKELLRVTGQYTSYTNYDTEIELSDGVWAPTIVTTTLPDTLQGGTYGYTLEAVGDLPITWAVTGGALPSGVTLSTDGVLSATTVSAAVGTTIAKITATNAGGSRWRELAITTQPNVLDDYLMALNPYLLYLTNEASGTAALNSGRGGAAYDGVITAGVSIAQAGASGANDAYDFNGTSGKVTIPSDATLSTLFERYTVGALVAPDSGGENNVGRIFECARANLHYNGLGGTIKLRSTAPGSTESNDTLTPGAWVYVFLTYDNAGDRKMRFYIGADGDLVEVTYAEQPTVNPVLPAITDLIIGNRAADDRTHDGKISKWFADNRVWETWEMLNAVIASGV